jgi:hypothetical protein
MEGLKLVAVVVPFYKSELTELEYVALKQCKRMLSSYPIIAIKPQKLNLPAIALEIPFEKVISFDDDYFQSISGYNRLLLSEAFYGKFLDYEYILIHQLDAFVFKDDLRYWCNQNIDYVGAPWIRTKKYKNIFSALNSKFRVSFYTYFNVHKDGLPNTKQFENKVGNGGFSLRRVQKFYSLVGTMQKEIQLYLSKTASHYNEDLFWSIEVNRKRKQLKIPRKEIALKFAFEILPNKAFLLNNKELPFGCHAWDKNINFWRPIFSRLGYTI